MRLVFKNVTVVNSDGRKVQDVFVEDGKIVGSLEGEVEPRVIDGNGKFLLPGVIDAHVHFREPGFSYKEDWKTGSAAARKGGVTTVLDMPNTNPPTTTITALEAKRALARERSAVNYGLFFGATSTNLDEIRRAEGIVGIKIYMGSSTGDLLLSDPKVWEAVFQVAKEKNLPVVVHAEDESLIRAGKRDCECALKATEAAIRLQEKVGNRLHIAHITCKAELDLLRAHKTALLTCEVTPHHLLFTEADQKDAFLKVYPPLRSREDQEALWEGLRDGTIDLVASDHAPHTIEEKQLPFAEAPAGVPGVEFLLPLMLNAVNEGRITLERLVALMSENPARIFGFPRKGKIEEAYDADLVLVDMELTKTITRAEVLSKCGWSPYEGRTLKGWPLGSWVLGKD